MFRRPLRPTESLNIPIRVFKVFGFWHMDDMEGKYKPLYYIYNKFIFLFFVVFYCVSQFISMMLDNGNFFKMITDGFYLALNTDCMIFKVGLLNKEKVTSTILFHNCKLFTQQRNEQDCYIKDAMKITKRNSIAILLMGSTCSTLWNLVPFLNGTYKQRILPFKAWYPFPQEESPYYEIAYAYQFIAILFIGWINLSTDSLMAGSMALTCGQLNVLKHSLRNIRKHAMENIQQYSEEEICNLCANSENLIWKCNNPKHLVMNDNALEQEICKKLQNCITHHITILKFVENFEDTFSVSLFFQFSASIADICITAFVISFLPPFTTLYFAIAIYLLTGIVQILYYCWYGNEIYLTSLTLNNDLYLSDWYLCGPRVRKLIIIMMERCKKPIILKGGKLYTLSLETFTSILRSAYSFYAVLQRLDIDVNINNDENE